MTLIKFESLREIETLNNRIQRYIENFSNCGVTLHENFNPRIDIHEDNENIDVTAEIPGVRKENIKLTLQDNILTIEGEKKKEEEERTKNFYRNERIFGSFKRCFTLPVNVDSDKVEAKFENGTLNIRIKKLEQKAKSEKIIELK